MKTSKRIILTVLAVIMALAFFTACAAQDNAGADANAKTITVSVITDDGKEDITVTTGAETLREALEAEGLIAGEEGDYGLFVQTVNGITADDANQEWWLITKNGGETVSTGVDEIVIADGETYEFTLTVGW